MMDVLPVIKSTAKNHWRELKALARKNHLLASSFLRMLTPTEWTMHPLQLISNIGSSVSSGKRNFHQLAI